VKNFKVIFKRSLLYTLVNALLIFVMLLIASACDNSTSISPSETTSPSVTTPPGTIIPFELFKINDVYDIEDYYYRFEKTAEVWVIPDVQQYHRPDGIEWLPFMEQSEIPEPPPEITDFNYSTHYILMVFNGY
jgi:hypothetical protein